MPPRKTSPLDSIKGIAPAIVRAFSMRKGSEELTVERAAYAEIGRIVGIPFSNPDVYARFAAQVRRLIPFDMIVITQLDVERGSFEIKYTFGMGVTGIEPGDTLSLKDSVVEKVAESNRAIRTDHYVDAGSVAESLAEAGLLSRIGTPLIANDEVVGTLHLSSKISEHYGNPELTRLEIVGNQIAGAISSAIRLQEERERSNQLKSLYAVAAILAQPLSFVEKAQGIVDELASITEADYVLLRRADKEHKHLDLVASGGSENINLKPSLELSDSNLITRRAYLTGQPILINDYKLSEGAQTGFSEQGVESMYFMPIQSANRVFGSLSVASKTNNYFDKDRVALITTFSNEIGSLFRMDEQSSTLQDSKLELESQNNELSRLNQALESHNMISQIFSEDGTFKEKAKSALEMLVLLTGADWVTFRLPNEPIPGLHLAAAAGPAALQYPPLQVITESESLSTAAFKERRTIVTDDYTICPTASPIIIAMGMKSQVFVPVRSGENTLGLLTVISKRKNAFDAGTVELLTFVVERFGVLVENALLHDESEKTREDLQVLAEALSNSNKMIHDSNMMLEERVNIRTQELEAARERAMRSEKLAIIGQLSGGIAHDLRNPLGAIKNAAYLTKRRFNSTEILENKESIVNLLELIDGEIGRAEDVITNLLSYGSNREITSTEIQIEDVIRNSLAGFVLEEDVSLITDTKPGLPSILGDASQLIRVLQNLVLNAQDAIQDSEQAEGCISIKAQRKDGSLEIVVADNGSGISPENLDKIFDPLYTAKSHGTGLGLAICQEIINKHNGTISVESEDGVGTSFRISIPFVANQANQTDQPGVA